MPVFLGVGAMDYVYEYYRDPPNTTPSLDEFSKLASRRNEEVESLDKMFPTNGTRFRADVVHDVGFLSCENW